MFRRRFGRRFRARRRRSFGRRGLLEKRNNYIETPVINLPEATTDTVNLLIGADAVDNSISNNSGTANVEKGSRIIGGRVHVMLAVNQTGTPARLISYALYKDAYFAGMTDIADISDIYQPSTTQAIGTQKKYTVAKGKIYLGTNSDKATLSFGPKILRKLGQLREGETVKFFVQNETTTASRSIDFAIHGYIRTVK